jgi:hypothetical protein
MHPADRVPLQVVALAVVLIFLVVSIHALVYHSPTRGLKIVNTIATVCLTGAMAASIISITDYLPL